MYKIYDFKIGKKIELIRIDQDSQDGRRILRILKPVESEFKNVKNNFQNLVDKVESEF